MKDKTRDELLFLCSFLVITIILLSVFHFVGARNTSKIDDAAIIQEIETQELREQELIVQSIIERENALLEEAQMEAALTDMPDMTGLASWYALDGNYTASGEIMDSSQMTAASMRYPMGSLVRVTNTATGSSVDVRINDTGGFEPLGRVIDLSRGAYEAIGDLNSGVMQVTLSRIQ